MTKLFGGLVLLVAVIWAFQSPTVRSRLSKWYGATTEWDAESRAADPLGFIDYAEARLRGHLEELTAAKLDLAVKNMALEGTVTEYATRRDGAMALANEFRSKYQDALSNERFPVEVRNAAYTKDQTREQIGRILHDVSKIEEVHGAVVAQKAEADQRLIELGEREQETTAQLKLLPVKRSMFAADLVTAQSEAVLSELNEVLNSNTAVLTRNPVRSVDELLKKAPTPSPSASSDSTAIDAFLSNGTVASAESARK